MTTLLWFSDILLWLGLALFILLIVRFVQPGLLRIAGDMVMRARIHRLFLDVLEKKDGPDKAPEFGAQLARAFSAQGASSKAEDIELRCTKIRELFGVLTSGTYESKAHPRVSVGLIDLSDMLQVLGHRIEPGIEQRKLVVDAGEILSFIARKVDPDAPADLEELETWLARQSLSVTQVGELLIAAIFALTHRETRAARMGSAAAATAGTSMRPLPSDTADDSG